MPNSPKTVTVAAACMKVEHEKKKNLESYASYVEEAASKSAGLLVFPEESLQGSTWAFDVKKFSFIDDPEQRAYYQKEAETIPGPSTEFIQKLASKHGMYIQIGMSEKAQNDGETTLYNAAALIGPGGLVGVHRKVYLCPNPVYEHGNRFSVFETTIGKIGPLICQDIMTPEAVATLAVQGAEIATFTTAWGGRSNDVMKEYGGYMYDTLTRANAIMNQVWIVSANSVGMSAASVARGHKGSGTYGHSRIVAPNGMIVAEVAKGEGLAIATIDVAGGIQDAKGSQRGTGLDMTVYRYPDAHKPLFESREEKPLTISSR
jgi:predicted amidohydrolase